ncbi:MAG: hypothetical protein Q9196_000978 [Gyalolechia fulgens]
MHQGPGSSLPHEADSRDDEQQAQGSADWTQFAEEKKRSAYKTIPRRIDEAKRKMGRVMQIAAFSLAEVTYAVGGDIGYQIQESAKAASFRVRTKQENVSGVFLPQFESYQTEGKNDFGLTGLGKGGQQVQRCRETYTRAVETLVELANINSELDELDREEFYRLKKVKNNKQRDNAANEAANASKRRGSDKENEEGPDASDVLGEQEDQDVIF